jgi:Predicted membrane protein
MDILKDIGITCLTSLISIAVLFLLTKLTGSKQVSQMTMFDYIVGISIGSIAAELATDLETTAEPLTALIFYGLAAYGISVLTNKSLKLRSIFTSRPLVLLDAGVIYRENLKKARLDLNEFLTFCRMDGYFDLSQVQTAILEHNGHVSFLPREPYRPLTPEDMKLNPKQTAVQMPFVMDGKILAGNLREAGKEEAWVRRMLLRQGYRDEQEVFLALWDGANGLLVFPMHPPEKRKSAAQ